MVPSESTGRSLSSLWQSSEDLLILIGLLAMLLTISATFPLSYSETFGRDQCYFSTVEYGALLPQPPA